MSQLVINLIASYSMMYGVDPNLAAAVIAHESNFDVQAVGTVGEIGLMQLRPEYFAESCKGKEIRKDTPRSIVCGEELFNPATNIRIGIKNLADLQKRCKHKDKSTFVICHNVGVVGGSRIQNPEGQSYYKKVMAEYERIERQNFFARQDQPEFDFDKLLNPLRTFKVAGEP